MAKVSACEVNKVFEHVMQYEFNNTNPWTLLSHVYS